MRLGSLSDSCSRGVIIVLARVLRHGLIAVGGTADNPVSGGTALDAGSATGPEGSTWALRSPAFA